MTLLPLVLLRVEVERLGFVDDRSFDGLPRGAVDATDDHGEAKASLKAACEKLLANTVIENYRVEIA